MAAKDIAISYVSKFCEAWELRGEAEELGAPGSNECE